jgi:predicted TIM-barrel fold metal-dependent hydrolase
MIWDLHCHLNGLPDRTPHERMAHLMEFATRMGIDRVIVFMGYPFRHRPSPDELRQQNDQVLEALSHWHDRALGFVYVSAQHVEASLREIERCVAQGPMVGLKLWVAERCADEAIDPLIRRAAELHAVVFQHTWLKTTGNLPGESTPMDVARMAARHPTMPLVCGHAGGDWARGIRAIRATKNVSIGLGGFDPTAGVTEMAVRELGPGRVLFGSDAPGRSFASQLAKVQDADITESQRRMILGGNLRRMLGPILKAKGVQP